MDIDCQTCVSKFFCRKNFEIQFMPHIHKGILNTQTWVYSHFWFICDYSQKTKYGEDQSSTC